MTCQLRIFTLQVDSQGRCRTAHIAVARVQAQPMGLDQTCATDAGGCRQVGLHGIKRAFDLQSPTRAQIDAGQRCRARLPNDGARGLQLEGTTTQAALAQPAVGDGQVAADLQRVGTRNAGAKHRRMARLQIEQTIQGRAHGQAGTGLHQSGRSRRDLYCRRIATPFELVAGSQPVVQVADRAGQYQIAVNQGSTHPIAASEHPAIS